MTALDTSVAVPALVSWHEHHELCRRAAAGARLPAHVLVETYSVLTRLPAPHRMSGDDVAALLARRFAPGDVLATPAALQRSIVQRAAAAGVEGGSIYDALVGLTARQHGQRLLTRDARAVRVYEILGVEHELLA